MTADATVFVVDDDLATRRSMRWLLESCGLSVETYSSGLDFLNACNPSHPGCILLDLQMPEMDGLELHRQLVSRNDHHPVIFVSGHGDVPKCAEAMKVGAIDFLEKPADGERILSVVHRALGKDRQRRKWRYVDGNSSEVAAGFNQLTPREEEVMEFLYEGEAMKNIASRLGISIQTVAKHRTRVLEKLQIRNEVDLVRLLQSQQERGLNVDIHC